MEIAFPVKAGVLKLWPRSQIWPTVCFWTACELEMVFTLLNYCDRNHMWSAKPKILTYYFMEQVY